MALNRLIRHELALPLAIAVASRFYSIAALLLLTVGGTQRLPLLTNDTSPLAAWDGQWYLEIASGGYHAQALQVGPNGGRLDVAFYPAWPALIRFLSFGIWPYAGVAIVLASLLFCLAALPIYEVLARHFDRRVALGGLALIAFAPPSFVFSMAYTESLFLLLAASYFATSKGPLRVVLAGLSVLTRITGLAIVVSALFKAIRDRDRWAALSVVAGYRAAIGILATLAIPVGGSAV